MYVALNFFHLTVELCAMIYYNMAHKGNPSNGSSSLFRTIPIADKIYAILTADISTELCCICAALKWYHTCSAIFELSGKLALQCTFTLQLAHVLHFLKCLTTCNLHCSILQLALKWLHTHVLHFCNLHFIHTLHCTFTLNYITFPHRNLQLHCTFTLQLATCNV